MRRRRHHRSRSRSRSKTPMPDDFELEVHADESDFLSDVESDYETSEDESSSTNTESDSSGDENDAKKVKEMEKDPVMIKFMERYLRKQGIKRKKKSRYRSPRRRSSRKEGRKKHSKSNSKKKLKRQSTKEQQQNAKDLTNDSNLVKSPSDGALYVPALRKEHFGGNSGTIDKRSGKFSIENLSDILTQIRVSEKMKADRERGRTSQTSDEEEGEHEPETARTYSDRDIIQAEKFKATIAQPEGKFGINFEVPKGGCIPPVDHEVDRHDGRFIASTCHVEDKCVEKICYGKFVFMDEIIPRKKHGYLADSERDKMELRNNEGHLYWVPKNEKEKVDNIQKWNQAFRVYLTIFSHANPHRASEIIQYMETINSAAASFSWENIAYYDFLFRKMMENTPQRSWAKICTELWTLAMRDPNPTRVQSHQKREQQQACWRFNGKNGCRKSAAQCKFEHRCTHCGGTSHGFYHCRKRPENKRHRNKDHEHKGKSSKKRKADKSDTESN